MWQRYVFFPNCKIFQSFSCESFWSWFRIRCIQAWHLEHTQKPMKERKLFFRHIVSINQDLKWQVYAKLLNLLKREFPNLRKRHSFQPSRADLSPCGAWQWRSRDGIAEMQAVRWAARALACLHLDIQKPRRPAPLSAGRCVSG